eukprot:scaffold17163_cov134-Isochrysis_galbana.AAC.1
MAFMLFPFSNRQKTSSTTPNGGFTSPEVKGASASASPANTSRQSPSTACFALDTLAAAESSFTSVLIRSRDRSSFEHSRRRSEATESNSGDVRAGVAVAVGRSIAGPACSARAPKVRAASILSAPMGAFAEPSDKLYYPPL